MTHPVHTPTPGATPGATRSTPVGGQPLWRSLSASAVGIEMGVCTVLGWLAGYLADGQLGTDPYLMLVGLLLGVAAGFNALLRTSKIAWQRDDDGGDA